MTGLSIVDGHDDLLSCLFHAADPDAAGFIAGHNGEIDLKECRAGGFAGGFLAVWAGNDPATAPDPTAAFRKFTAIDVARARTEPTAQISTLLRLCRNRPQATCLCTSTAPIKTAQDAGAIAAILHIGGCEAIGVNLNDLHLFHSAGLRSPGPVWSRPNIFGHGVRLAKACNTQGVPVDLNHLNEAGFRDVARVSDRPLVATHSSAHAVTPCTQNLTDRQLDAMAEPGGLAWLNFGCQFLRRTGSRTPTPDRRL